jgi:hypothetical protein
MVMGIPKDLFVTDKGADDNALTMPILPKRNHKKQTFQHFFGSTMALMTFLQRTTKIFLLIHSRHVETSPLLSCSSAAPLDIDVVIQRARTLARSDLRHRMQLCKFATEIIDVTTYRSV